MNGGCGVALSFDILRCNVTRGCVVQFDVMWIEVFVIKSLV